MAGEFFAEASKMVISAVVGGLATSAAALPIFYNKLTKVTTELQSMKENCTVCKTGVDKSIEKMTTSITSHHEDDDKHNTKSSERLLNDILARVVRIENKMFNGHSDTGK